MSNPATDEPLPLRIDPVEKDLIDLDALAGALVLIARDTAASPSYKRSKARKKKRKTKQQSKKGEEQ